MLLVPRDVSPAPDENCLCLRALGLPPCRKRFETLTVKLLRALEKDLRNECILYLRLVYDAGIENQFMDAGRRHHRRSISDRVPYDSAERNSHSGVILELREVRGGGVGYIALYQPDVRRPEGLCTLSSRTLDAGSIDWRVVQQWLQICNEDHTCTTSQSGSKWLTGFKVIDVRTRKIVPAPVGCQYVALSYVWGKAAESELTDSFSLPELAALTIEDAMTCTRALDIDYLWVDRYCIDQNAADTKHAMIQNMDKIYADATLTIIDAAGSCASSGLAGVSETERDIPEWIILYGQGLSVVPDVTGAVRTSEWNSRGWTYQEGLLSNRRLIFTRSQVYFQCLQMHCCEALAAEFPVLRFKHEGLASSLSFFTFGQDGHAQEARAFSRRLSEYLPRTLSYESDTVKAFSGILRRYWYTDPPTYNFWGLRIERSRFIFALLWRPGCKDTDKQLSRRPSFPSWTWAGWWNITSFDHLVRPEPRDCFGVSEHVRDLEGKRYGIEEYVTSMTEAWDIYRFKPIIYLNGWTTDVWLRPQSHGADIHTTVVDIMGTLHRHQLTSAFILRPYLSAGQTALNSPWTLFFWIVNQDTMNGIVLKHVGGQRHERAGVIRGTFVNWLKDSHPCIMRVGLPSWPSTIWLDCRRQSIKLV